jgi:hypothetical protein
VSADQPNDWWAFYQAALLEPDPVKLPERVERAYSAIQICLSAHPAANGDQYQALADALANLRVLRREITAATDRAPEINAAPLTRREL